MESTLVRRQRNQLLRNFRPIEMTDHEFALWLKAKKWNGEYDPNPISGFTQFWANSEVVALVLYRNQLPVSRFIYIREA